MIKDFLISISGVDSGIWLDAASVILPAAVVLLLIFAFLKVLKLF